MRAGIADIREKPRGDGQKMKESFKEAGILWVRDGSCLLMKPSITPSIAQWAEGGKPAPRALLQKAGRRGGRRGGRLQCAGGAVISTSLPPVKSAGKVIRPASLLLFLLLLPSIFPCDACCNSFGPLGEACCWFLHLLNVLQQLSVLNTQLIHLRDTAK